MEQTRATVGRMPLDDYVKIVAQIYSKHDKYRSVFDVWCHTLHHAAAIAEEIRKGASDKRLYGEIADFSLWLFTAVVKLTGKIGQSGDRIETPQESIIRIQSSCSDLLWHKYPGLCPSCCIDIIAQPRSDHLHSCLCFSKHIAQLSPDSKREHRLALLRYSEQSRGRKPNSIDEWQEMFGTIFEETVTKTSLTTLVLHLMEELGETSDAMIRMYSYTGKNFHAGEPARRQSNLESQLADVFSRLFSLVQKINMLPQKSSTVGSSLSHTVSHLLSEIIWDRYGSGAKHAFICQSCGETVCKCDIILVPTTRRFEELLEKAPGL